MAIKVFCNSCQRFIKDIQKRDLSDATGTEICTECYNKTVLYVNEVKKIAGETINKINGVLDKALAEFDEAKRRVTEPNKEE